MRDNECYGTLFRLWPPVPYAAARERMTIYAENFKDEISFALGYVSPPPAIYNRLFGRRTKFSSRHPWDRRATNNTEVRICNQATA